MLQSKPLPLRKKAEGRGRLQVGTCNSHMELSDKNVIENNIKNPSGKCCQKTVRRRTVNTDEISEHLFSNHDRSTKQPPVDIALQSSINSKVAPSICRMSGNRKRISAETRAPMTMAAVMLIEKVRLASYFSFHRYEERQVHFRLSQRQVRYRTEYLQADRQR